MVHMLLFEDVHHSVQKAITGRFTQLNGFDNGFKGKVFNSHLDRSCRTFQCRGTGNQPRKFSNALSMVLEENMSGKADIQQTWCQKKFSVFLFHTFTLL